MEKSRWIMKRDVEGLHRRCVFKNALAAWQGRLLWNRLLHFIESESGLF